MNQDQGRVFFEGDEVVAVYCMTGRHARGRIVQPGPNGSYVVEVYLPEDVIGKSGRVVSVRWETERHLIQSNSIALIRRGANAPLEESY